MKADDIRETKGVIFDIQRGSAVDGPGIRTTVFFKGCNLSCAWCHNPESREMQPQMLFYREKCTDCGTCRSVCPQKGEACVLCGKCTVFCPNDAKSICGKTVTAGEVFREILRDVPYYESTGGGATFSGGESLLQPDFLLALLKLCRENGISAAVDTAGNVPYETLRQVLPYTDLFLYDIKAVTPALHKTYTGVSNERILSNYKRLFSDGARLLVRIPMVAEVNANDGEFPEILRFLKAFPPKKIELLPYHALGTNKYKALYQTDAPVFHAPDAALLERYRREADAVCAVHAEDTEK